MIGRSFRRDPGQTVEETDFVEPVSFDDFELRLGDLMRGERATLGKSLLDVQRELKIKAAYIAAIENCDPTGFETPGFIAGYVRSYARYLNMEPEWAYDTFCKESGFTTAHGMSPAASTVRQTGKDRSRLPGEDMFAAPATPFVPVGDSVFSRIEAGAVGSVLVLVALIGGLGYGGWTVLQEVQKVQFAPVEQAPVVAAEIDPLAGGAAALAEADGENAGPERDVVTAAAPSPEALDRLYRPQALDVPVMTARDAPISTLNPSAVGALALDMDTASGGDVPELQTAGGEGGTLSQIDRAVSLALAGSDTAAPAGDAARIDGQSVRPDGTGIQVREAPQAEVMLVAIREAWVRVKADDGSVLLERILQPGETYAVPALEQAPTLRTGDAGAVYFAVNGQTYGPYGGRGQIADGTALAAAALTQDFAAVDPTTADEAGREAVQVAEAALGQLLAEQLPLAIDPPADPGADFIAE